MKILIEVDAPISEAHAIKELLAMKIECIGKVRVVSITDDGYGCQQKFDNY